MELNQLKQIIWEISEEALCQVACDWYIIKSLILFNYNKIIYSRRSLKLHKRVTSWSLPQFYGMRVGCLRLIYALWSFYSKSAPHFPSKLPVDGGAGLNPRWGWNQRSFSVCAHWQQQQQQQVLQRKVCSTESSMAKYKPWLVCCFILVGLICAVALVCLCAATLMAGCPRGSFTHAAVAADSRICSEVGR